MKQRLAVLAMVLALSACGGGSDEATEPVDVMADETPQTLPEPGPGSTPLTVSAWMVESVDRMSLGDVETAASAAIGGELSVELLFPEDSGLESMYLISSSEAVTELAALDVKYALTDLPEFTDAAPDYPLHQPLVPRSAAAACKRGVGDDLPDKKGWSLGQMNVQAAWSLTPGSEGKMQGEGVQICHPDTGWAEHLDLDSEALDLIHSIDLIDDASSGVDPLNYRGNAGHGTATGSVLISRGGVDADNTTTPPGEVTGVAPKAKIVPIRTIKSVVRFLDSNTARAVNYARGPHCDVISMSLGGAGFFGLRKAVQRAVEDDKIIVAASGNCVGFIVAPASYKETVAAAASNIDRKPWKGSSKGKAITVTAPGEAVYIARRGRNSTDTELVEASNGTSFATAAIAAAAANWIAFHGKDELNAAKGDSYTMTDLFKWALPQAVDTPEDWDTKKYGPGILDLNLLLLVDVRKFPKDQPRAVPRDSKLLELSDMIDRSPAQTRELLQYLFGDGDPEEQARTYGAEIQRLTITDPDLVTKILTQVERRLPRTAIDDDITDKFSARMRAAVR